jgi:hypothetical protein
MAGTDLRSLSFREGAILEQCVHWPTEHQIRIRCEELRDERWSAGLAYGSTLHKAQKSEFGVVFVAISQNTRFLTRELLYTELTRSKRHLVLLIEERDF